MGYPVRFSRRICWALKRIVQFLYNAIEKGFNKKIQPKIDLERDQPAQQSAKNAQQKTHPI